MEDVASDWARLGWLAGWLAGLSLRPIDPLTDLTIQVIGRRAVSLRSSDGAKQSKAKPKAGVVVKGEKKETKGRGKRGRKKKRNGTKQKINDACIHAMYLSAYARFDSYLSCIPR